MVGVSYNAGDWGAEPQSPEANGSAPDVEEIFTVFTQKIRIFKHTLI